MADFVVNTNALRSRANSLQVLQNDMNNLAAKLRGIHVSSFLRSGSSTVLNIRIQDCAAAVSNQAANLRKLASGLDSVATIYDRTEKDLSEPKTQGNSVADIFSDLWEEIQNFPWQHSWPPITILNVLWVLGAYGAAVGDNQSGGGLPGEWSLLSDRVEGSGSLLGIPCAGEAGYSLIGYETDSIGKATWNLDKGEAGIEFGGEVSGHLIKGDASGHIGILGGSVNGSVGNVAVSGKVGATLFEDGKFSPAIGLEVKGEASVLKGSAEGYLGNEDYNAHANASGTVLGAEAKAEAKAGVITYTDKKTGETVTTYGAKAEVGAEAYIAEGKVSGGISFMGIDIDIGISGKAGGAGVEAGGSITTNGVSGEIGAGLGLGAGVEISIDWTDFDPPTFEEIGQGIQDAGKAIGKGIQDIGEGIQDVGEAISDWFNW